MNTVKVKLPDGNTAQLYAEMKHKTQRAVEEATRQFLTYPDGVGKLILSQGEDGGPVKAKAMTDEVEVTAEVLGNQSEDVYAFLKNTVDAMYQGSFPLAQSGVANSAKGWPLLSRFRRLFAFRRN